MNSRGRSRKEQKNDVGKLYGVLESMKPSENAHKRFKRKAYEIHDVSSYINSKYIQGRKV